ncbi:mast cell carboxypeptidase A-like [Crotalus adamanteus]|uniref:Mast cell carboxypeptidase A-like n=1 Tax=Crotalus adamanteus TaxID=8729 RepID=A0AAW1BHB7_CROAD
MKSLSNLIQIDFWYPDTALHIVKEMEVDFHVSATQSNTVERLLQQNGIPYEILFDNLQKDIEKQLDGDKNDGHSYEQYNEWDKVQNLYDIRQRNVESSAERIPIYQRYWEEGVMAQWLNDAGFVS